VGSRATQAWPITTALTLRSVFRLAVPVARQSELERASIKTGRCSRGEAMIDAARQERKSVLLPARVNQDENLIVA